MLNDNNTTHKHDGRDQVGDGDDMQAKLGLVAVFEEKSIDEVIVIKLRFTE